MGIPYVIRKQFVFECSPKQLSNLLNLISDNGINITGAQFNCTKCGYKVDLVVGPSDVEENESIINAANNSVKIYLKEVGIKCYKFTDIIQLLPFTPGTPGVLRTTYNTLYQATKIINTFLGESNRRFYSVCDLEAAKYALDNAVIDDS